MKNYTGLKQLKAIPMNRLDYVTYRGWTLPADENGEDEGYLVEYLDGGKSNHPDHKGYISWSPKDVFENSYKELDKARSRFIVDVFSFLSKESRVKMNAKQTADGLSIIEYKVKKKK